MSNTTQLTSASSYNVNRMIFSSPVTSTIPNSIPKVSYKRVNICTKNQDGTCGDLVLCTENLFSFGVSENKNQETGKVNGYSIALCLWNRDNPSKEEKEFTDKFNEIVEHTKDYLISNRDELEQYELEPSDLKKFNPMYWKRDRNGVVPGTGPSLYPKLIVSKKDNTERIISTFYDKSSGQELNPMLLMGKYCYIKAAIKIESVFVGNKLSFQIKLWEAEVELLEKGMKRLLTVNPTKPLAETMSQSVPQSHDLEIMDEHTQGESSIHNSDDDVQEHQVSRSPSPVRKIAPAKRGGRAVGKK
jgi:hypothetical protein